MQTPHISLGKEQSFAKTVLMPGDPKRARWIAAIKDTAFL